MSRFVLALDASQINEYLTCPRMWYYRYRRNLVLAGRKTTALDKGTVVHQFSDLYYNLRGMQPSVPSLDHCTAVLKIMDKQKLGLGLSDAELAELKMRFFQYCARYSQNDIRVKVKKGVPAVELGFSKVLKETSDYLYVVEGRIDLIGFYDNKEMFTDHKTQQQAKDLYKYCPQFLTYAWATRLQWGMINYIGLQKEMTDKTFRRTTIFFPSWRIANWERKMIHVFDSIRVDLQTPGFFDSTYSANEHSCGGAFQSSPCMFTRICETDHLGLKESIINHAFEIKIWKPWEVEKDEDAA